MTDRQGYYSVIQYSPFPERFEFVNVGVVLFMPGGGVRIRLDSDNKRIEKVFGRQDRYDVGMMRESIENRIKSEFGRSWAHSNVQRFVELRSGKVQMSRPLPYLVKDADADLNRLFEEMVPSFSRSSRRPTVASLLKQRLRDAGVLKWILARWWSRCGKERGSGKMPSDSSSGSVLNRFGSKSRLCESDSHGWKRRRRTRRGLRY